MALWRVQCYPKPVPACSKPLSCKEMHQRRPENADSLEAGLQTPPPRSHPHAIYMRFTCVLQAIYLGCGCDSQASYMRLTCVYHALYMLCTCYVHAMYMRLTCVLRERGSQESGVRSQEGIGGRGRLKRWRVEALKHG